MSSDVDSDRENLFQILTARSTATKDEVLEFSWALEKKYANEKEFFHTYCSTVMLVCHQINGNDTGARGCTSGTRNSSDKNIYRCCIVSFGG